MEWGSLPPFTTVWMSGAMLLSILEALGFTTPYQMFYSPTMVFQLQQYWRLLTTFLYFGGFSVMLLLRHCFMLRYAYMLERDTFGATGRADFFWFLFLAAAALLLLSSRLSMPFLAEPLSATITYVWCRKNRHVQMSFLGLFVFTAPYMPLLLLLIELGFGRSVQSVKSEIVGIVLGHIYYFLVDVWPREFEARTAHLLDPPLLWTPPLVARYCLWAIDASTISKGTTDALCVRALQSSACAAKKSAHAHRVPLKKVKRTADHAPPAQSRGTGAAQGGTHVRASMRTAADEKTPSAPTGASDEPATASGGGENTAALPPAPTAPTFPPATSRRSKRPTTLLHGDEVRAARVVRLEEFKKGHNSAEVAGRLSATDVTMEVVSPLREMQVAKLAHGLDRVLFNAGVHWLRDQRTGIYNFDPHLRRVLDVDLFDYNTLPRYLTSSRDPELLEITKKEGMKYCGSTSSLTGLLSHCYFLLSRWKDPELGGFSASFQDMPTGFSEGAKLPVSIVLRRQPGGFYAVDADKSSDDDLDNSNYVLTSLGKSLEKFLTAPPHEYRLHERMNSWKLGADAHEHKEAYHYAKTSRLLMRSQLDCADARLPHRSFDLKTRAVVSVRQDRANYVEASGYQITQARGLWESFEREYWDMVRAAFLKYNFQVRIGHMDGIFVAYHNTAQIFGFQYIPLEEMNARLFGSSEMGDQMFNLCVGLLERIFDTATAHFPDDSLAITLETRSGANGLTAIIEPVGGGQVLQLDVAVDRYLNGALVRGPMDATALLGGATDAQIEAMANGRTHSPLTDLSLHVDYCITPRHDLSEDQRRATLAGMRQRQQSMQSMCMPNVDLLNAREEHRINVLRKRPEALARFLREREDGTAIGMPLAPGQHTAREAMERSGCSSPPLLAPPKAGANAVRWQRVVDATTRRLREISRHGRAEADARDAKDPLEVYERT
ncbi:hypothetical protein MSPP1_001918 [Malassezia sp. CBS 17886]|nr:hypothetical protein MSPP1_001918 [Malassezia sp. CBS 17886]